MRRLITPLVILTAAWWLWSQFTPIRRAPGVLIKEEPAQSILLGTQPTAEMCGWKLKPLATYRIKARVLSKAAYKDDAFAGLAPYDLALGWGPMSDSAVLDRLDVRQFYRYFEWHCWSDPMPVPRKEICSHAANVHIIPADAAVLACVRHLRTGSLVLLSGDLVEASKPGEPVPLRSSLTRTDTGEGACEIMLVRVALELD